MKLTNYKVEDLVDIKSFRSVLFWPGDQEATGNSPNQRVVFNTASNKVLMVDTKPDKEGLWLAAKEVSKDKLIPVVKPVPELIYTSLYQAEEASEGLHEPFKVGVIAR